MKRFFALPPLKLDLRWILLLVLVLIILILAWPDPASGAAPSQGSTPTAVVTALPTATPIPPEYLAETDQTTGIICGSVILVLIIVGGTVGVLRRRSDTSGGKSAG